jgi:LacI family transcriptional regulator
MDDNIHVTLKSIADELHLSLGTVHNAIYDKKGVSKETRQRVLSLIKEKNYSVNIVASSLKRKNIKIGVLLPKPVGNERYFFQDIWNGIEQSAIDFKNYNVQIIKMEYTGDYNDQIKAMEQFYDLYADQISGLITHLWHETKLNSIIDKYVNASIRVALIMVDAPRSNRLFCISSDPVEVGRMAGELMGNYIPSGGRVIIMGGKRESSTHQTMVLAFIKELKRYKPDVETIEIYDYNIYYENGKMQRILEEYLTKFDNITGIYSNNARGTILLCRELKELKKAGNVIAFGSDVNEESVRYLNEGVLNGVIYQNPFQQAYQAVKTLMGCIITNYLPQKNIYVDSRIVLRSNASSYFPSLPRQKFYD